MLEFAHSLPTLRSVSSRHLGRDGFPSERVLGCAVRLLDRGFFRIGSEGYTEQNGSYGLATMQKEHARVSGDEVRFDYLAKGGKQRVQSVVDPEVATVVRSLKRRRNGGNELLAYRSAGEWRDVRSHDINDYIKEVTGGDFSAKDFRTWHATVLAAVFVAETAERGTTKTSRKRAVSGAVHRVSEYLGNTPAVCRASYIDPRIFDHYRAGTTIAGVVRSVSPESLMRPAIRARIDQAVLFLLEDPAPVVEEVA
jgi:DNA topoisomerase-1